MQDAFVLELPLSTSIFILFVVFLNVNLLIKHMLEVSIL